MNIRAEEFELGGLLALDLEYAYSCDPGCYSGPYEKCYPAEEDYEVLPPDDLEKRVREFAEAMIPFWVKQIEDECCDMARDRLPKEWLEEDYSE